MELRKGAKLSLRTNALAMLLLALIFCFCVGSIEAQDLNPPNYTSPLPTGVRLDPVGEYIDLGSMPIAMALAPDGKALVVVLSGWRQQGIQVVDLRSSRVSQTLEQAAAFYGVAFSPDGQELYASGGNDDTIFCYVWEGNHATFKKKIVLGLQKPDKTGSKYPAGIAASRDSKYLYVAENVDDTLAVVNLATSEVVQRLPTDHYPYAVEVTPKGAVYVSAWGGNSISAFEQRPDGRLSYHGRLTLGRHPSALASDSSGSRLFVALGGSDRIAIVDTRKWSVLGYLNDAPPAGPNEGSTPNALALSHDGSRLFVAEADNNAVAVFDISEYSEQHPQRSMGRLLGRIPTDWYPTGVLNVGSRVLVLTGKGHGAHANPDGPVPTQRWPEIRPTAYALGQLNGTLRIFDYPSSPTSLRDYSRRTSVANGWGQPRSRKPYPAFKHVLYIIKENRTYDQVLGDLKEGDGDPSLVFFGQSISPNHHALALRFGLFDRFFTNSEVSSQGHIWSTASYVTDYGEKMVPSVYSDRRGDIDGEEAEEPERGFLWTLAKKSGISFRDYGEMVAPGWPVTQPDLGPDISPNYPPFDFSVPDQKRADVWISELNEFVRYGDMPQLEVMHLPFDHLAAARPGKCTPRACMADNDLALGRIVEALSQSPYWRDTVVFVVEDDAQAGPDHLDSHRAPFFAISAYSHAGTNHRFINTTDVVAAIEDILGMGRLSKFDYFSRSLADIFARTPDLTPYRHGIPQVNLEEKNPAKSAEAQISQTLDLSAPDRVNDALYNQILWSMLKGNQPMPAPRGKAPIHIFQLGR